MYVNLNQNENVNNNTRRAISLIDRVREKNSNVLNFGRKLLNQKLMLRIINIIILIKQNGEFSLLTIELEPKTTRKKKFANAIKQWVDNHMLIVLLIGFQ